MNIQMPAAFSVHNKNMGGVDVHDQYCSKAFPAMRSKKWTYSIFIRLIKSSLTNVVILSNVIRVNEKKMNMKDFAVSVATYYLQRRSKENLKTHKIENVPLRRYCSGDKCEKRITSYCADYGKYFCVQYFHSYHTVS